MSTSVYFFDDSISLSVFLYYSAVFFIFVSVIASMVTTKSIAHIFSFFKNLRLPGPRQSSEVL